ncbi:TRAP transporter small permease [Stutzerimonas azotifigens]|uniref:TRAP transporter small permease n=1 Tax=Stutzerimonas azotifigens TaxID=291995 RepID=UPI0003F56994|nr:TRAP transporter small permease [Stutzerimonas azotifigens]
MKPLKPLYGFCGLLSGVFMVLICVLVVTQIIARLFGTMVPSSDELAGYAMASSGFLGLPYALHRGAHIRVSLLFKALSERGQHLLEIASTLVGLVIVAYLAWFTALFVHESYVFGEVSSGLLPIPMWMPQVPMALGTAVLVVAMLDRLVSLLTDRSFEVADAQPALSE